MSSENWLAEAAAAENQRFFGGLTHYRSGRSHAATSEASDQQPTGVSPEALADAAAENAEFQQHVANYDPNLFRRGRRRQVEYDKPVGARPATVQDAADADAAFFRSLRNWSPD